MAIVLTDALAAAASPSTRTWTREEFLALDAMGAFDDRKYELVDGELIAIMGKNRPHAVYGWHLVLALIRVFGGGLVNTEIPVDVAPDDNVRSAPVPDIVVLRRRSAALADSNPKPEDLWLVAEVSDSTLTFDCTTKANLYARAGIVEYWVLDVRHRRLIVHRDPSGGQYRSVFSHGEQDSVEPLGAPSKRLSVAEAFPRQ